MTVRGRTRESRPQWNHGPPVNRSVIPFGPAAGRPTRASAYPTAAVTGETEDGHVAHPANGHAPGFRPGVPDPASTQASTRVLICGDIPVVRDALATLLDSTAGIDVVGTTGSGMEAIILARTLRADVVVTNLKMTEMPGVEMVRRLRGGGMAAAPQVVVFAITEADEIVSNVLHAGASGVLDEHAGPADLISAIRLAARGQVMLAPAIAGRLVSWFRERRDNAEEPPMPALYSLTPREREVMLLIARGLSAEEIAEELTIGVATARTHVYRVRCKLGARDRAQLVSFAFRCGLVPRG